MKKKKNLIAFIVMEILLLLFLVMIFVTPLMNRNLSFKTFYNNKEKELVDIIIESINKKQVSSLEDKFIEVENLTEGLSQLDQFFELNHIDVIKLANCNFKTFTSKGEKTKNTLFEYSLKFSNNKFGLLVIEINTINSNLKIRTIRIQPLEKSIEEINSFYGEKIDFVRIFILLISVIIILSIIYTEYDYYIRVKNNKLWLQLLLPVSILGININWNTLAADLELFTIKFFPISSFSSGNIGVWKYTISFPILVILYWLSFRKKYIKNEKNMKSDDNTAESNLIDNDSKNI